MAKGDVVLDFSEVRPFEPMDSNPTYLCTISDANRQKGEKGEYSAMEFTIDGPDEVPVEEWTENSEAEGGMVKGDGIVLNEAGEPVMTRAKGRKLFRNFPLMASALPYLHELIKGADPNAELGEKFNYNEKNYVGLQVAIKIRNRAWDGQVRADVRRVMPATQYKG